MTDKRVVVWPGYVRSKNDRDRHYIGVPALMVLYGVRPGTRYAVGGERGFRERPDDINLHPRFDGKYPVLDASGNLRPR